MRYLGVDEAAEMSGIGYVGEVAQGPDGRLYQYVQTVDGLGNPVGFWKRLRKLGQKALRHALPLAQRFAPFVPGVGPVAAGVLSRATPLLRRAGLVGVGSLGALYQAPNGTLYRMEGLSEGEVLDGDLSEDELQGFAEDELQGFAADDELQGFGADDELQGLAQDDELRGIDEGEELSAVHADDELDGLAEDSELQGLDQGYVREPGVSAYVPQQPPATRWYVQPTQPPAAFKPLW